MIHRTEFPDSIELSRAGKGCCLKVYYNASNEAEARSRVDTAIRIRAYTIKKLTEAGVQL
jgi:hypothetical protein